VCIGLLAAAVVALPLWLMNIPEPDPLPPPPPSRSPATSRIARVPAAEQPALPDATQSPPHEEDGQPAEDEAGLPIVERRWTQDEAVPARVEGAPPLDLAPLVETDRKQARSAEGRRRRVRRFGGTPRTEDAVEAGLTWLAAHQDLDGTWNRFEFNRHCPANDKCAGVAVRRTESSLRSGLTGLALLAFLGAGYTDREGPHQQVVTRAVKALLGAQMPDGGFDPDERMAGYNDALSTFALAEYYALTQEPRVRAPLERAVTRLVLSQQELGGWDYVPRPDSGRNDTSITAWIVQALHACVAAGIHVPPRTLISAALHFERAAGADGRVWYSDAGTGFRIDEATLQPVYRYGPAMTAAGLTSEQLLGWRSDSGLVRKQQAGLFEQMPSAALLQGGDPTQLHSYYYWYYGTIAMFQAGGERWERWNANLRDAILPLQNRDRHPGGSKKHAHGSWPPFGPNWGKWGRMGGRVYTTAIAVLTLEIYYRQTPAYLVQDTVLLAADWQVFLREAGPRQRRRAIAALREMRIEIAEPVLVGLLTDSDRAAALDAAIALTVFDSPLGRPLLEESLDAGTAWERRIVEAALQRAREIEALPPVRGTVRAFDRERGLATLELPRAYVGLQLTVYRAERPLGQLRVVRRFTGRTVVVAQTIGDWKGSLPEPGDPAISR
jgi:hypothetical protein